VIDGPESSDVAERKVGLKWSITVRRCSLVVSKLVPKGESITLDMHQALRKFVAGNTPSGRSNLLRARSGCFLGIIKIDKGERNFLLINPDMKNDIGWLLRKSPEIEKSIKEVYRVDDVIIPRNAIDLPPQGFSQGDG